MPLNIHKHKLFLKTGLARPPLIIHLPSHIVYIALSTTAQPLGPLRFPSKGFQKLCVQVKEETVELGDRINTRSGR